MKYTIIIILIFGFQLQANAQEWISIKNASDCNSAIEISTLSKFGPTGPPKEVKLKSADNPFGRSQHQVWYKFKAVKDGILLFDIIPIDLVDNYDFLLYKIESENYCDFIKNGKLEPLRSNISKNDPDLKGLTGLSVTGKPESYSKGIDVKSGEQYLLVLNNMYKGKGHTIVFKYLESYEIEGTVNYAEDGPPIKAEVFWTNLRTRETTSSISTNKKGEYKLKVSVNSEVHRFPDYLLWAYAEDYYIKDTVIASRDIPGIEKRPFNFKLPKLKKGNNDFLPKIFFEPNASLISSSSTRDLERILHLLRQNQKLEMILEGHSNGFYPSTDVDKILSEERAEMVKEWLINNGTEASRLSIRGFGSERMLFPMAQDEREEGMNRRVEFFISKF